MVYFGASLIFSIRYFAVKSIIPEWGMLHAKIWIGRHDFALLVYRVISLVSKKQVFFHSSRILIKSNKVALSDYFLSPAWILGFCRVQIRQC